MDRTEQRNSHPPQQIFSNQTYGPAAHFLQAVIKSGRLSHGPAEVELSASSSILAVFKTIPWRTLLTQLVWSSIVTFAAYFAARNDPNPDTYTLTTEFRNTSVSVSPFIASSVGWALFVLLALFILESGQRYHQALKLLRILVVRLNTLLLFFCLNYSENTWHPRSLERIAAHLIAYPIALKMTLRKDRSPEQLQPFLHPADVQDCVNAQYPHLHCPRVVRSYTMSAESDSVGFHLADTHHPPVAAYVARATCFRIEDIDCAATTIQRIAYFHPAVAYVQRLAIF